jgi:hypothetical protein
VFLKEALTFFSDPAMAGSAQGAFLQICRRVKLPSVIAERAILPEGNKTEQNFFTNLRVRDRWNVAVRDLYPSLQKRRRCLSCHLLAARIVR